MVEKQRGIHVFAGSYEYDRIVEPLFGDFPVEKIIALRSDTSYPIMTKLTDHFIQKLRDNIPREIETVSLDIYNFDEVFRKTLKILREYSKKDIPIFLNISSAPKLTLVAMISAAYFFKNKGNIEIFYVAPETYLVPEILEELDKLDDSNQSKVIENLKELRDIFRKSGIAVSATNYELIPLFPIEGINELDLSILEILDDFGTINSITALIEKLKQKSQREVKRTSVQYRLKKLRENNLIKTKRVERRMEIEIARLGEIYLKSYTEK
ncbi:hypothetical protein AKJ40_04270 [candidate division MSBL1 archaeon SCGC-AAA259M10]|uniref:HFX-2341-like N-terminal domain-containing protein n=2 Tax=candidate division MSBL1 TaxID=215777 RepID=A0A133UXS2_9EURY|nr:hypothetical protein AKJ66_03985 [candidate division MSBL1 archaeon SCGC-AAA259E22]KXA98971.1 hypothetical protein AKJ40_04270 [candidate division MSBL1 archaeon SCGC-AAA259M10]